MKFDFSGYATRNDIKCSDGRTIRRDAFKHQDGSKVPLVWQHSHDNPANVLGHVRLENREDGVYAYGKLNQTTAAKEARELIKHGDIVSMSIFANRLKQQGGNVVHGAIREVSLVLSGANPGAFIDNVNIMHSDGSWIEDETEAVIYSGEDLTHELEHSEEGIQVSSPDDIGEIFETFTEEQKNATYHIVDSALNGLGDEIMHAETENSTPDNKETVEDIFKSLNDKQKNVVYYLVGKAMEESKTSTSSEEDVKHSESLYEGEQDMKHNIFDAETEHDDSVLSHDDLAGFIAEAKDAKASLRETFLAHAQDYGIEDIDILFPEARTLTPTPEFITREMGWVPGVLSAIKKTPFSRIKTIAADITADEARAKGYVKGNVKKDEVFSLLTRTTTPQTIYKKQKLDRDDIVDITDFDVVSWMKKEMRMMLDEEIARAVLVGDGREVSDDDKIRDNHVRSILHDDHLYSHKHTLEANVTDAKLVDEVVKARKHYKGSGSPVFYTTADTLTDLLLLRDNMGRRLYRTESELASEMRVSKIVEVPVMEDLVREDDEENTNDVLGIVVNLKDYTIGADKGGAVTLFDDFDIDYNQMKYLIETRISGALVKVKSALVIEKKKA